MKKYYIPTSSLNFNNILSTESVSPKSFYVCRRFGYDRWTSIPENSSDFVITLYDYPGSFVRTQTEIEDHPLLIEYSTDEEFERVGNGVYVCDHTLYLNPAIARFIFFTDQDKTVALSLTESSLETKLVSVYKQRISVETFEKKLAPIGIHEFDKVNEDAVAIDRQINRMKGLLYGYYVGASISATSEHVKELGAYLVIQNIFAAIVSSANRMPTETQRLQLSQAFAALNRFDPLYNELLAFERDASRVDQLYALLSKFGKDISPHNEAELVMSLKNNNTNNCYGIRWIKERIQYVQNEMIKDRVYLSPDKEEILIIDGKLKRVNNDVIADELMQKLFIAWVNDVFVRPEFNGKVSACKSDLADALTFKAKDVLGGAWVDGNYVRHYLNAIRKHIIGKNEFSEAWRDDLLSAVAAVLSKGDDWDVLLRFMQSKGLTDYRLAFAIYGELNGFANLTRDFTDVILGGQNKERRAMYQEFYGQLLGQSIDWSLLDKSREEPYCDENFKISVLKFFDSSEFKCAKKKKPSLRANLLNVFDLLGENPDPNVFIQNLAESNGWDKPKALWKLIQKKFVPCYTKSVKTRTRAKGKGRSGDSTPYFPCFGDEHPRPIAKLMLEDSDNWRKECAKMIYDRKAREVFEEDAIWFVGNHRETYEDTRKKGVRYGYYHAADKTNKATIDRYESHLRNKLNQTDTSKRWLVDVFSKVPIVEIIRYLRENYV